jgi:hypothetical protein
MSRYNEPEDVAIRPHDRRFDPCETVKAAVVLDWVDSDRIARIEVESGRWLNFEPMTDKHGLPRS